MAFLPVLATTRDLRRKQPQNVRAKRVRHDEPLIWSGGEASSSPSNVEDSYGTEASDADATQTAGPGGGDGIGIGSYGGPGGGGGGDGSSILPAEVLVVLKETGRSIDSLPVDILDALRHGRADVTHLKKLLEIEAWPVVGPLAAKWDGLRDRLIMNQRFWMVVCVELAIGFGTKTAVEVRTRADRFWKEFDFYLSDIALEIVGDFSLVWLLSPAMQFGVAPAAGSFAGYKGVQFGLVGLFASLIGHSATKALVSYRQRTHPEEAPDVHLAPVVQNSIIWGWFMMISSSPRYQLVNGIEQNVIDTIFRSNLAVATVMTFALRFGNCWFGGVHWLHLAKQLGLQ